MRWEGHPGRTFFRGSSCNCLSSVVDAATFRVPTECRRAQVVPREVSARGTEPAPRPTMPPCRASPTFEAFAPRTLSSTARSVDTATTPRARKPSAQVLRTMGFSSVLSRRSTTLVVPDEHACFSLCGARAVDCCNRTSHTHVGTAPRSGGGVPDWGVTHHDLTASEHTRRSSIVAFPDETLQRYQRSPSLRQRQQK
jgi:hypothetical protein